MCARFDGRQFHGAQTLRALGKNRYPRGVQLRDHLYVAYQTDVAYPAGGGLYQDIAMARVDPRGLLTETVEWVTDMKYNTAPGLAVLGDSLIAAYAQWDQPEGGRAGGA